MNNLFPGMMQQVLPQQIMQRFQQFQRTFSGDPRQQVQQLLNSGKVSQEQYNSAVQTANQFARLFGIK